METITRQESLSQKVAEQIAHAKANAMLESHLVELENEALKLASLNTEESFAREDEIEKELLASSVVSQNLTEYKEVLQQIARMYHQNEEWVTAMLAHENAHANVAENLKFTWVGYVVLFAKNETGDISLVQPAFVRKTDRKWTHIESQMKQIAVIDAPAMYDNYPSDADTKEIEEMKSNLDIREKTNKQDAAEIQKIRKELGNLYRY